MLINRVTAGAHSLESYTILADVDAATTYTDVPEDLFPGMSSDGTDLTIPIAALSDYGLTAAQAVASTGDARQVARCFTARIRDWYASLASAARPTAMEIQYRQAISTSGDYADKPQDIYTCKYYLDWPDEKVADEA